MESYSTETCRLDEFWINTVFKKNTEHFGESIKLVKIVCVLSHENAWLERGFSANKKILVRNLKETSLIAQWFVCDYVKDLDLKTFKVDSKCLGFIWCSRSLYEKTLKSHQLESQNENDAKKKRKLLKGEIDELEAKRKKCDEDYCDKNDEISGYRYR